MEIRRCIHDNSAFGVGALYWNDTGYENSAFGLASLFNNTTGWHNTAFGFDALRYNTSGFQNTAVGHHSLQNNTGNYNTAIGYNAGSTVTTGYNLTLVGIDANPSSPTANDQITLGNIFVSSLRCNVQTITSLSDARDKKNIKDLTLGLDFITKLKPRQFNWDRREWYSGNVSNGSKMDEQPTAGFIAQEFDEIQKSENAEWLKLVLKDNPENEKLASAVDGLKIEKDEQVAQLLEENKLLKSEIENLKSLKEELAEIHNLKAELIAQINLLKADNEKTKFTSIEKEIK